MYFFEEFAVNLNDFRVFWLRNISYGDNSSVVVVCELWAKVNNFTSVDHSIIFCIASNYYTSGIFL